MTYYQYFLIVLTGLVMSLMMSCKDEIECDPPHCGIGYTCVEGDCICPEGKIELNDRICRTPRKGWYFGTFDCGCFNDLIIAFYSGADKVSLMEGHGVLSTQLHNPEENIYTFLLWLFDGECEWDDTPTQFVQVEMEKLEPGKLWVTAQWTRQLGFEVAYECSAMFVDYTVAGE